MTNIFKTTWRPVKGFLVMLWDFVKMFLKAVVSLLSTAAVMLLLTAGLITVATLTSTVGLFSTQSGSMLPRYPIDALLVSVPTDWETIREGDVVTLRQAGDGKAVTHRVIKVSDTVSAGEVVFVSSEDGKFERLEIAEDTKVSELRGGSGTEVGYANLAIQMRGDANPSQDAETYLVKSQVWKPVFQIKGAGKVLDIMSSPSTLLWIGGVYIVAMVVLIFVRTGDDEEASVEAVEPVSTHEPLRSAVPSSSEFLARSDRS